MLGIDFGVAAKRIRRLLEGLGRLLLPDKMHKTAMAMSLPSLSEILRLPGMERAVFGDLPAWLWDVDGRRVLFANAAGVSFFGVTQAPCLLSRSFDVPSANCRQIEEVAATLPEDGAPQMAMLRFFVRMQRVALPCSCRRVTLNGSVLMLILAAAGKRDGRSLADRSAVLFDHLEEPVAVQQEGQTIYRNAVIAADGAGVTTELPSSSGPVRLTVGAEAIPMPAKKPPPQEPFLPDAGVEDTAPPPEAPALNAEAFPRPSATPDGRQPTTPKRFSFVLDAEMRIVGIGPALEAAVGAEAADVVGREWTEVAEAFGLDPEGQIRAALETRDTWSGVELDWPSCDGGTARVRLAALPRFGPDQVFAGYRGFGDVIAYAPPAQEAPQDPGTCRIRGKSSRRHDVASEDHGDPSGTAAEPEADRNVVHLPPNRQTPFSGNGHLNDQEQTAFKKIAEALGARLPDEEDAVPTDWTAEAAPAGASDTLPEGAAGEPTEQDESHPASAGHMDPREPGSIDSIVANILGRLPTGVAIVRDERILFANRAFLETFDYTDLDDLDIAGGLTALFEGKSSEADAAVGRRRDGSLINVESRIGRIVWIDGPAMFLTARELPESRRSGPPEADEIAELKAILDTASDGVLILSGEGLIEGANRSAEALFSRDSATMVGRYFTDLLAPESRASVSEYLRGLVSGGVMSVLNDGREIIARAHRGGDVPLFLTIGRIGESDPARFCAVMRDLTQWKAAEAELIAARARAEDASAHKSDFLARMSHEIRTPLNAIIGFAEVMLGERFGPIGNDRYREYVEDIRKSGEHIMSLVNDLLDLSKIEAGKLELTFASVNLNDVVEQSVAIMQPQANRERVIIRTSAARGLPPVVADVRSLRQVMLNLLSNGIKFTNAGGQVIVSTMVNEKGEVKLRIRDTGIGMSESDVEEAIEPFRQLPVRSKSPQKGTGLGLPLSRALVEANRADFTIHSRLNEGTLIEISFPHSRVLSE